MFLQVHISPGHPTLALSWWKDTWCLPQSTLRIPPGQVLLREVRCARQEHRLSLSHVALIAADMDTQSPGSQARWGLLLLVNYSWKSVSAPLSCTLGVGQDPRLSWTGFKTGLWLEWLGSGWIPCGLRRGDSRKISLTLFHKGEK